MELTGRVFVVAGPSGAGKDTLISEALSKSDNISYSVSATTRPPRDDEVDGRDYHFLTEKEFDDLIKADALLEWEEVYGHRYGTLKREVEKAFSSGKDALLELDVKGALHVKSKVPDAKLVFIMPPSFEELEARLRGRESDGESDISKRIEIAPWEMKKGRNEFDFVIINRDVDEAASELAGILRGEID